MNFTRLTPAMSAKITADNAAMLQRSRNMRKLVLVKRSLCASLSQIKDRPDAVGNVLSYAAGKQKARRFDGEGVTNFWDIT